MDNRLRGDAIPRPTSQLQFEVIMETINLAVNTFDASALDAAVFQGFTNVAKADDESRSAMEALLDAMQIANVPPTDLLSPYDNNGRVIASNERKSTATVASWGALQFALASGMRTLEVYGVEVETMNNLPDNYHTCASLIAVDKDKLDARITDLRSMVKGASGANVVKLEAQIVPLEAIKTARSIVNKVIGSKIRDVMDAFINRLTKSKHIDLVIGGMDKKAAKDAAESYRQDLYDSVGRKNRAKQKSSKANAETLTLDNASKVISSIIELARESEDAWFDVPKLVKLLNEANNLLAKH